MASEPLLFDPVAMSIGADGRLWVVEMRAFMPDVNGTGENAPIGTIAVLEDTDGDGRMDQRTEFAGGLVMPRAISCRETSKTNAYYWLSAKNASYLKPSNASAAHWAKSLTCGNCWA